MFGEQKNSLAYLSQETYTYAILYITIYIHKYY